MITIIIIAVVLLLIFYIVKKEQYLDMVNEEKNQKTDYGHDDFDMSKLHDYSKVVRYDENNINPYWEIDAYRYWKGKEAAAAKKIMNEL